MENKMNATSAGLEQPRRTVPDEAAATRDAERRLAKVLREYLHEKDARVEDLCDPRRHLGVSRATAYNLVGGQVARRGQWPRELSLLRRIAQRTGASVDWLLGFPVPKRRENRELIGDVGAAIRGQLVERRPATIGLDEVNRTTDPLLPSADADLLRAVASRWWRDELVRRYKLAAKRLRRLAAAFRSNEMPSQYAEFVDLPEWIEEEARRYQFLVWLGPSRDVPLDDAWSNIIRWERGEPLDAWRDSPHLTTPFRVPYGKGFTWRDSRTATDGIWFIDPETGEPKCRRGRFLIGFPEAGLEINKLPPVSDSFFSS